MTERLRNGGGADWSIAKPEPRSQRRSHRQSRDVFDDHFPDVVALAVQHRFGGIDRHPDYRLRRNERRGRRHQLHWFHVHIEHRGARLCELGLHGRLELAYL